MIPLIPFASIKHEYLKPWIFPYPSQTCIRNSSLFPLICILISLHPLCHEMICFNFVKYRKPFSEFSPNPPCRHSRISHSSVSLFSACSLINSYINSLFIPLDEKYQTSLSGFLNAFPICQ